MPRIPAICQSCSIIFQSPINIRGKRTVFMDCETSWPKCGASVPIPDGVYSAVTDTALAFTAGRVTLPKVQQLLEILKSSCRQMPATEDIADKIKTDVPELSSIGDVLPKNREQLYGFLTLIILIIGLIVSMCKPDIRAGLTGAEVRTLVDTAIENLYRAPPDLRTFPHGW